MLLSLLFVVFYFANKALANCNFLAFVLFSKVLVFVNSDFLIAPSTEGVTLHPVILHFLAFDGLFAKETPNLSLFALVLDMKAQ